MNIKPFISIIAILLISFLYCNGCYNRVDLGDSIAAVAHGLDISPDGTRVVSSGQFALPPQADDDDAPKFLVRSASGPTFSSAEQIMATSLPRDPVWSMAETFIIGENIARRDISLFLDHLARTNAVREVSLLFLAYNSTPEEVLKTETAPEDTAGRALVKMIQAQEAQIGLYSPVTIKEFLYKVSTAGVEPVLPQVKIESFEGKDRLSISGLAVFRGKQMVGSLNEQESRGYHFMQSNTRGGLFVINLPDPARPGEQSLQTLETINSTAVVKPVLNQGQLKMRITITAEGNIYEVAYPHILFDLSQLGLFEQQANAAIQSDVEACLRKAQACQSDILGWGQAIQRQQPALWENLEADWPAQFASIPYEIEIDFKLRRTYLQGRGSVEE